MNKFLIALNLGISLVLFSFIGSFYATGVFSSAIDLKGSDAIRGKWASSMGPLTLISTPSMILAAVFLESGDQFASKKSFKVKILTMVSAFFFAGFGIAANGVHFNSSPLIVLGVSMLGIPLGVFYLLCTELVSVWMPNHVGLAVGIGQAAFGLGTIVFSSVFSTLIESYGTAEAIWYAGLLLGLPTLCSTPFLSWPKTHAADEDEELHHGYIEIDATLGSDKIGLSVLARSVSFWLYVVIVFCSQTGFAMVPFFFDMGTSFGSGLDTVILLFQFVNIAGTLARLFGGILTDYLSIHTEKNGAKSLMTIFLAVQTLAFLSLGVATNFKNSFWVFILASAVLFVTFSGGACISAILARELFGSENSATVYGLGGGIAIGFGESGASFLVANLIAHSYHSHLKFRSTFFILAMTSFIGFMSAKIVSKSKEAFTRSNKPNRLPDHAPATDVIDTVDVWPV